MSDYDFRPGGSLKLKGGVAEGGVVKKKKKSSKSKSKVDQERELERLREARLKEEVVKSSSPAAGSSRNSPAIGGSSDRKTEAERRFEETQKRRMAEKVARLANKTHKDRVSEFNSKLEALSEHHDIPKVGPG
ncbi:DUF1754-domain-containing protein [Gloeophyllum trabeum ATCC 11539]|uniref:DUF1754-domain-containing protein n=1 Tax=Gloeophyllum trabeum (strain ATCC 11539 / FP-39264 / Madison 617) TaxID=670483 RepID=S7QLV3_GLOTA|nr:DUF1754-domain-containing protein [Gloeophyllum trabeum ATCC 11539]EPQ60417.1 DUF1754-domain-containing protein [Gloeophyllum trabeum ATCC 11539]